MGTRAVGCPARHPRSQHFGGCTPCCRLTAHSRVLVSSKWLFSTHSHPQQCASTMSPCQQTPRSAGSALCPLPASAHHAHTEALRRAGELPLAGGSGAPGTGLDAVTEPYGCDVGSHRGRGATSRAGCTQHWQAWRRAPCTVHLLQKPREAQQAGPTPPGPWPEHEAHTLTCDEGRLCRRLLQ